MSIGKAVGQTKRNKANLVNHDNPLPILRGTAKDHKAGFDLNKGPDMRPIMGAKVGPNTGLSQIACQILRAVKDNEEVQYEVKSTEELLALENTILARKMGSSKLLDPWI